MDTSKIIRGVVNGRNYTVTAPIIKEDYGLYLKIEGVELPSTYEVDFSNSENNGTSVTMIGNSDGVLIPRQFIDSGKDVFAFLYHVGADFGRTVYKFRIPNKVRPDRTNEEPTPEEQSVIDQAISALNEAVAQTAQDVIDADASAQSASADAERAEEARTDAQTYANNAQTSANNASASAQASANSATASAQSASEAEQIKTDVHEMVDDAQGYANSASQSASQASASEQGCARAVLDAASAAAIARARADEASGYAQTASSKATEASGYASTASQKATEASQSATNAQGYAQTAEQAKTDAQTAQGLAESARDSAISAKNDAEQAKADAESARDEAQSIVDGISGALDDKADIITDTASGAIASFSDGADNLPLKSLVIDINPIQDLSNGDPSPENICPISGWTGANVYHSGADTSDATTYPITFPSEAGTVYGGTLNVLTGVLTVDKVALVIDGANIKFDRVTRYGTLNRFGIAYPTGLKAKYSGSSSFCVSDKIKPSWDNTVAINTTRPEGYYCFPHSSAFFVSMPSSVISGENTSEANAWAETNRPTVCYELDIPYEIQLTPHEVNSLLGVNNIWADTGDTEVIYRADTELWVQRKITEAVAAVLNS